jgi:ribonucleoside-diphosphate reductase alpha chain
MTKTNGHSKKVVTHKVNGGPALLTSTYSSMNSKTSKTKSDLSLSIKTVVKSTGKKESFDLEKLRKGIILAGRDTKAYGKKEAEDIVKKVFIGLSEIKGTSIASSTIRELVEPIMAEQGYFKTARYYILYGARKDQQRKEDFEIWEPEMTDTAKMTLVTRCSRQDANGELLESAGQILWRVARHMAKAEINWGDEKEVEKVSRLFFDKMANFKFVCTRSALYEAGNDSALQQLSPCFVLRVEDNIPAIFKTLGDAALVQKNYGGTGFNFSNIRFKGDKVRNVSNVASGPVDFLQVYSAALSKVVQGAKRHGGNMGVLNVDHPDIYDFVSIKDTDGTMKNFNISVGATNEFMEAVVADKKFALRNPRDGSVVKTVKARKLFHDICVHAWATGDPGMLFLDRMEEDNFTPTLGKLDATNPCGEQPLLPYESCNLSSVHLARHLVKSKDGWEMNWDELGETVKTVIRFLDNMIEQNYYVLSETEKMVKHGNRKIGLGMIGLAEVLFKLQIPYNSPEGVRMSDKIAKYVRQKAEEESLELAKTRGVFPHWDISTYKGTAEKFRNCTMITIAPTGTVSMIGNTTSGVEPCFALVYTRRSFYNEDSKNRSTASLYYVDPTFEQVLKERELYSEELITKIAENGGSIQDMKEIPADIRKVFVTTHDIKPEWHVRVQGAFQKYADNAVSKTINFRHDATIEDVEEAYMLAWKLGCKGITIYRDGSKDDQVLNAGIKKEEKKDTVDTVISVTAATIEVSSEVTDTCPECSGHVVHEGGCATCHDCGWSVCKI